jgi:hypothetical protein
MENLSMTLLLKSAWLFSFGQCSLCSFYGVEGTKSVKKHQNIPKMRV